MRFLIVALSVAVVFAPAMGHPAFNLGNALSGVTDVFDDIEDVVDTVTDTTGDFLDNLGQTVGQVTAEQIKNVQDLTTTAANAIEGTVETVMESTGKIVTVLTDSAGESIEISGSILEGGFEITSIIYDDMSQELIDAANNLVKQLEGAVGEGAGAVTNAANTVQAPAA